VNSAEALRIVAAPNVSATSAAPPADASPAASDADPQEWLRRGAWQEAATLTPQAQLEGALRDYLAARLAFETGRYEEAASHFAAVDETSALAPLALAALPRALLRSGKPPAAKGKTTKSLNAEDWVVAAEQWQRLSPPSLAGPLFQQASQKVRGVNALNARLHAARARWATAQGLPYRAYVDWRWLATEAVLFPESEVALAELAKAFPQHTLRNEERRRRVELLADAGRAGDLAREFERWQAAPGVKPTNSEQLHYLGFAHYRERNYPAAAALLAQSAQLSSSFARDDRYYTAQALSRLGQHAAAIEHYQALLRGKESTTRHRAAFRLAREYAWLGQWEDGIGTYSAFIDQHPGSEFMEAALRERAVLRYNAAQFERAAFEFKRLNYLRPRSKLAPLYRHLEGLSLLATPRAAEAIPIFTSLAQEAPLSFAGLAAQARLRQLARAEPALEPQNLASREIALPAEVNAPDVLGLTQEAEQLLTRAEPTLKLSAAGAAPFEAECEAHGQLFTGRRRLLLGLSAASRHRFYEDPRQAPTWLWRCLYPSPYSSWVAASAVQFEVPTSLVYAVMRQESGFRAEVVSNANAFGLMQVIPTTGAQIALELGEETEPPPDLRDPYVSIRFGSYYLSQVLRQFGGQAALAAAAYNAGPDAVSVWRAAHPAQAVELFVASIPFEETQGYVMNVLQNFAAYRALAGENVDVFAALELPLPTTAAVDP
jgi:soluble lytic murein transglycosylase